MAAKTLKILLTALLYALRCVLFGLAYVLLLLTMFPLITNTNDVRRIAETATAAAANDADVRIGGLQLAPLSTRPVVLRNLVITPANSDTPAVEVGLARVRYGPRALLRRQAEVRELLLKDAVVRVLWRGGEWNLQRFQPPPKPCEEAPEPEEPGPPPEPFTLKKLEEFVLPMSVDADRIAVENLTLIVDKPGEYHAEIRGLTTTLEANLTRRAKGQAVYELQIDSLSLDSPRLTVSISKPVTLRLAVDRGRAGRLTVDGDFALDGAQLKTPDLGEPASIDSRIELRGSVEPAQDAVLIELASISVGDALKMTITDGHVVDRGREALKLTQTLDANLQPLLALLPPKVKKQIGRQVAATGTVSVTNHIDGRLAENGEIAVDSDLRIKLDALNLTRQPKPESRPLRLSVRDWGTDLSTSLTYALPGGIQRVSGSGTLLTLADAELQMGETAYGLSGTNFAVDASADEFPQIDAVVRTAKLDAAEVRLRLPGLGSLGQPFSMSVKGIARNAADFRQAKISDAEITAGMGRLIPELRITGDIFGLGRDRLDLEAKTKLDVRAVLDAASKGLPPDLRKKLGSGRIAGTVDIEQKLDGRLPRSPDGTMRLTSYTKLILDVQSTDYTLSQMRVKSEDARLTVTGVTMMSAWDDPHDMSLDVDVSAGPAALGKRFDFEGLNLKFYAKAADRKLSNFLIDSSADCTALNLQGLPTTNLNFNLKTSGNLTTGEVDLPNLHLEIPELFTLSLKDWQVRDLGAQKLKGHLDLNARNLAQLTTYAGLSESRPLSTLTGAITCALDIDGKLPIVHNYVRMQNGRPVSVKQPKELKLWPLPQFIENRAPLTADLDLTLKKVGLELGRIKLPEKGEVFDKGLQGLGGNVKIGFSQNQLSVKTELQVADLRWDPVLGQMPETNLALHMQMRDWDILQIEKFSANTMAQAAAAELSGKVYGLLPLLEAGPSPRIDLILNTLGVDALRAAVRLKTPEKAVGSGLTVDGTGRAQADLSLIPGERLAVDVKVAMDDLTVTKDGKVFVKALRGTLPFSRTMQISTAARRARPERAAADLLSENVLETGRPPSESIDLYTGSATVAAQLTDYQATANMVRADAVLPESPYGLKNLQLALNVEEGQFLLDHMRFDMLGGKVRARAHIIPVADIYRLFTGLEFTNINLSQLLPENLPDLKPGDAHVNASAAVTVRLREKQEEAQRVPLDDIEMRLFITKVGSEALDRLLLFLDPDQNDPDIVRARNRLELARPKRVSVEMKHGLANIRVDLQGLLAPWAEVAPIKYVPVGKILQSETIQKTLKHLVTVQDLLRKISADTIYVDEEGRKVQFR